MSFLFEDSIKIKLDFPDVAVDEFGNTGFWSLIYNQVIQSVL